jgi:predicted  nucleic acid-binding Zn-ribbon protein
MGRLDDNAPVGHTCSTIDDVISSLTELHISGEPMSRRELIDLEKTMNQIRSDNGALRDWGNQQCQLAYELEKEMDYYKDLSEKYKDEIDDLKSEIKELEKQVV